MITLFYKDDLTENGKNISIEEIDFKHIRTMSNFVHSDKYIYIDEKTNQFKILKDNRINEFCGVIIEDLKHIVNFI